MLVLVFLLAIIPNSGNSPSILHIDKVLHFLIFLLLTFVLDFCTRRPLKQHLYLILLLIGFGVFIEVSQHLITTRSADILDWVFDSLGVLVYLLFAPNISIGLKK